MLSHSGRKSAQLGFKTEERLQATTRICRDTHKFEPLTYKLFSVKVEVVVQQSFFCRLNHVACYHVIGAQIRTREGMLQQCSIVKSIVVDL